MATTKHLAAEVKAKAAVKRTKAARKQANRKQTDNGAYANWQQTQQTEEDKAVADAQLLVRASRRRIYER